MYVGRVGTFALCSVVDGTFNCFLQVAENIKEFFHNEGIHSTTIQPEFIDYHSGDSDDCMLKCPSV